MVFGFDNYTVPELRRLCWLRAIEWLGWPAFISQPLLPILYVFYPVYLVLGAVVCVGLIWLLFRYHFVSLLLAEIGCLWVRLKWLTIPVGTVILLWQRRYITAVIAVATPWLVGLLAIPGEVGVVELKFMSIADPFWLKNQAYEDLSAKLGDTEKTPT